MAANLSASSGIAASANEGQNSSGKTVFLKKGIPRKPGGNTQGPTGTPGPTAAKSHPRGSGRRSSLIIIIASTMTGATAANILRYSSDIIDDLAN